MNPKFEGATTVVAVYALIFILNHAFPILSRPIGFPPVVQEGLAEFQKLFEDDYLFAGLKVLGGASLVVVLKPFSRLLKKGRGKRHE